jgi:hypothetical protein
MSEWKAIAEDNASYIGSIFDDWVEEVRNPLSVADLDTALKIGTRDERIRDLEHELEVRRDVVTQIAELRAENARQRAEIGSTATRLASAQAVVDSLHAQLAAARSASASRSPSEEIERLQAQASKSRAELTESRRSSQDSLREAERLQSRVSELEGQLLEARSQNSVQPTEMVFNIGQLSFRQALGLSDTIRPHLDRSAKLVFSNPDGAVLDARRAIEAAVAALWAKAFDRIPQSRRSIGDLLFELREQPSLPGNDWHLAKNLYSRASAIVHEGGATPQIALWIWLGTIQIAELASADDDGYRPS